VDYFKRLRRTLLSGQSMADLPSGSLSLASVCVHPGKYQLCGRGRFSKRHERPQRCRWRYGGCGERSIRRELPIQFGHEQLTSYGGLELVATVVMYWWRMAPWTTTPTRIV